MTDPPRTYIREPTTAKAEPMEGEGMGAMGTRRRLEWRVNQRWEAGEEAEEEEEEGEEGWRRTR